MNYQTILAIVEFLGEEMTDEQAAKLMDECRFFCSISEMEKLRDQLTGPLYTLITMHEGEMGGYGRY